MTNIKLRIEGDRILTDTGVEVGYTMGVIGKTAYCVHGIPVKMTLPEAEAAYNAHLAKVLGDRVVVQKSLLDGQQELVEALVDARDAIASLPQDALGTAYATGYEEPMPYPIRDEVIHKITSALAKHKEEA